MKKVLLSLSVFASLAMMSCGGGPALCDCVNIKDDADEKMKTACETMETEWKAKYEKADEEAKKKLEEEIMACQPK